MNEAGSRRSETMLWSIFTVIERNAVAGTVLA